MHGTGRGSTASWVVKAYYVVSLARPRSRVPLHRLRVGDRLKLEDGSWSTIEGVRDTGRYEAVYNFRVSEFHTYFVGDGSGWGWAVWAHNLGRNDEIDHLDEMRVLTEREGAAMKATPSRNSLQNWEPPSFVPTWELHLR